MNANTLTETRDATAARQARQVQQLFDEVYDEVLDECYQILDEWYLRLRPGEVDSAMQGLRDRLETRRSESSDIEWNRFRRLCRAHPVRKRLHEDPFSRNAFAKPRGYPGDATVLDFVYEAGKACPRLPDMTELGREIFRFTTATPPCQGVRSRARRAAHAIDDAAERFRHPRILSVAAGHLREADLTESLQAGRVGRWVALDGDPESLKEVRCCYERCRVETIATAIRNILLGKLQDLGQFELIYSTGLFDYLQQPLGRRLATRLFEMLRPGGQLLIANFTTGLQERGYMETFMDWRLVYRDDQEMLDLTMAMEDVQGISLEHLGLETSCPCPGSLQPIVFLVVTKK
jgi:hypothetical protein